MDNEDIGFPSSGETTYRRTIRGIKEGKKMWGKRADKHRANVVK
jgi:hypothetical protein